MIQHITAQEAHDLLSNGQGYVYLDVRTCEEFAEGHAPGAINVPVMDSEPTTGEMFPNAAFADVLEANLPKDARVLVGCRSGGRSMMAAQMMETLGYKNVHNVLGGFGGSTDAMGNVKHPGWCTLGLPVERGGEDNYAKLQAKVTS